MDGQPSLCTLVVGAFETGCVEREDGVVLQVGGRVTGLQAEDCEDEDCNGHQLGENC